MTMNAKWYLVYNPQTNRAYDYVQIPAEWRDVPNMLSLTDKQLATIDKWSSSNRFRFLDLKTARAINVRNIDKILELAKPNALVWLRQMRDAVLNSTDMLTLPDRMATFDIVGRRNVLNFRQELRDITKGNVFNPVWPRIPAELNSIRKIDISSIERPHPGFLEMLNSLPTPLTIEQKQTDQWLRIKTERDRRKDGGVKLTVNGADYWFWTDDSSRIQYTILIDFAAKNSLPATYVLDQWKTMSGAFVPMTSALLQNILMAGVQNEKSVFQTAELHRLEMLDAEDPAAYDWKSGWPATFDEYVLSQASNHTA